jgi:filamentous hemagglutinin family protein
LYSIVVFFDFGLKMKPQISLQSTDIAKKPKSILPPWVRRVSQALTVLNLSLAVSSSPVWAVPIVPNTDGTKTKVNLTGNQFDIKGGTSSSNGKNLFHSFKDFNLEAGQVANFISNPKIQNILGRINGGNPSVINGLLQVSGGNSNLFLLNPSGIIFGQNATLNVPAAFTATTANGIAFGNGWFSATGANDYKVLNSAPTGFAFSGSQVGAIVNAGNLTVGSGQSLILLGGTVASTGQLSAPDGQVMVSAVPGTSYVKLTQAGQLLSFEVKPLSSSATLPNASSVPVVSLPQLLTGPGAVSATGLTVDTDGTVRLTDSDVDVASGDVTVKSLNAGTGNLTAANTLSLVGSQVTTAKDLTLSAQNTVTVSDGSTSPVMVNAGGNLSVTGNGGINITTLNASGTPALQSGGDLKLSSEGLINVNASLSSGGNLSFLDLMGGSGNLVNNDQTSLQSKGVITLGNYRGVSLKVEADGSIRGGDFTITGRKKTGVALSDPDYETLTYQPALILRAGLKDPASIISVGNVTARGGIVDFSTNGNIFTGNIDVSPDNPFPIYGYGNQRITLKGYNIFTGNLNAGSDVAPGVIVYKVVPYYDSQCYLSDLSDFLDNYFSCGVAYSETIQVPSGSISLDATQYLRAGDISTRSRTSRGGNVTIQASDAIVGAINTNGASVFKGGDVSVKTIEPLKSGAITTDGATRGTVSIGTLDTVSPPIEDGVVDKSTPSIDDLLHPQRVLNNLLKFTEARRLAGQKKTAQEIALQLDIPIDIAQMAVLDPIGDNIQVPTPDLTAFTNDSVLVAGDDDFDLFGLGKLFAGLKIIYEGATGLFKVTYKGLEIVATKTEPQARRLANWFGKGLEDLAKKIPSEWGPGIPTRKQLGIRWQNPNYKGDGIRIDKGNPNSQFPSQRVDHVIIRKGGKVIGKDGKPISDPIKSDPTNSHIPFSEWIKWTNWFKP